MSTSIDTVTLTLTLLRSLINQFRGEIFRHTSVHHFPSLAAAGAECYRGWGDRGPAVAKWSCGCYGTVVWCWGSARQGSHNESPRDLGADSRMTGSARDWIHTTVLCNRLYWGPEVCQWWEVTMRVTFQLGRPVLCFYSMTLYTSEGNTLLFFLLNYIYYELVTVYIQFQNISLLQFKLYNII